MNTAYRVWDGEQMHYWDDGELSLIISGGEWGLYRNIVGALYPIRIASSTQKNTSLMWGTGQTDENGKMIYPGNEIEFYVEGFSITSKMVRLTKTIETSGGIHNVPGDYGENIRIIGDVYEKKEGAE